MSILTRLRRLVRRDRDARRLGEQDAPAEPGTARERRTGGAPQAEATDAHSTTGTTPSGTFVGRVAGDEADGETSGAETRTGRHAKPM